MVALVTVDWYDTWWNQPYMPDRSERTMPQYLKDPELLIRHRLPDNVSPQHPVNVPALDDHQNQVIDVNDPILHSGRYLRRRESLSIWKGSFA